MRKRNSIEGQLSLFPDHEPPLDSSPQPHASGPWPAWPEGLWVGTSSWSFPGWSGSVYDRKYPESKLSQQGLRAYSRHPLLAAVGIDRTYYAPMTAEEHKRYADQVPDSFRFLVKAPERLTTARFARHSRNGALAGLDNPDFLSPRLAVEEWIEPAMAGLSDKLGCLLLQFPPLSVTSVGGPAGFAVSLHRLLEQLPPGPRYAVEIRNKELFGAAYLQVLERLEVSHCLTVHPSMPSLELQAQALPPQPLTVIRWMLGSTRYDEAVARFEPFDRLVEEDRPTRSNIVSLWRRSLEQHTPVLTIVNNKAEGCSPRSIERLAEEWWSPKIPF
jgi:uncharacterized protein YecE (DUF72 family)